MLLLSLPLSTTPCPTFSQYFLSLYAICLHFSILLLSFPLPTIFPAIFYAIFLIFLMLLLSLPLPSTPCPTFSSNFRSLYAIFLAFSHTFALISSAYHTFALVSSAYHHIYYIFYTFCCIFLPYSATTMADLKKRGVRMHTF